MKDWTDMSTNQWTPKRASQPPEVRKRQGRILPYRFQRQCGPFDTWILDVQPTKLRQ